MRHDFRRGVAAALPVCIGYLPIGLAFGVLAQKAGLSVIEIGLMSVFVFAGSSQFIAVSMIAQHAGILAIMMTTFIVNLRHLLMSSSLAVVIPPSGKRVLSVFAYGITDESFAINHPLFKNGGWNMTSALSMNHAANMAWILSTMAGGYGGQYIPENAFGLNYAMTAMFICLLVYQLRERIHVVTAILSGFVAVILYLVVPGNGYIVLAALAAATIGTVIKRSGRKHSNRKS
ncbi:MAG: AzlC family ABC transporter permease [Desulfatirhabdiaceae bacterium]